MFNKTLTHLNWEKSVKVFPWRFHMARGAAVALRQKAALNQAAAETSTSDYWATRWIIKAPKMLLWTGIRICERSFEEISKYMILGLSKICFWMLFVFKVISSSLNILFETLVFVCRRYPTDDIFDNIFCQVQVIINGVLINIETSGRFYWIFANCEALNDWMDIFAVKIFHLHLENFNLEDQTVHTFQTYPHGTPFKRPIFFKKWAWKDSISRIRVSALSWKIASTICKRVSSYSWLFGVSQMNTAFLTLWIPLIFSVFVEQVFFYIYDK